MMFGLMRVRTHDAEMAAKDVLIDSLDKTAKKLREQRDMYMSQYQEAIRDGDRQRSEKMRVAAERDTLQARLDALTPARGQGGRFAKREAV